MSPLNVKDRSSVMRSRNCSSILDGMEEANVVADMERVLPYAETWARRRMALRVAATALR